MTSLATSGLGGRPSRCIYSYLTERKIFVSTQDDDTKCHLVTKGVLKVGVFSPTLFNVVLIGLAYELLGNIQVSLHADNIFASVRQALLYFNCGHVFKKS